MKKLVTIAMLLLLSLTMSVSVFAVAGGFVSSPSVKTAPTVEEVIPETEGCTAQVVITGYGDRNDLPEANRLNIEAAYTSIVGASDIGDIHANLITVAEISGVPIEEFAISDLFDISRTDCEGHEDHGALTITIGVSDPIENLVCLLRYTNGAWEMLPGDINEDGTKVTFETNDFGSYAIVVSNIELQEEADSNWGWIVAAVTGGTALLGGGGYYFVTQTATGAKVLKAAVNLFKKKS